LALFDAIRVCGLLALALVSLLPAQPRPRWHGRKLPQYSLTIPARGGPDAGKWKLSDTGSRTIRLPYGHYKVAAGASLWSGTRSCPGPLRGPGGAM